MLRAALVALAAVASPGAADAGGGVLSAQYTEPTTRYAHGALGDTVEYGALEMRVERGTVVVRLPVNHVFEDIAPRLSDVDGDGDSEVIVVETDMGRGAALAVYDEAGKVAETPHIGRPNRWLAPAGAADIDGDGAVEIAYVDRPHLAKILRIWRFRDGALHHVADIEGLSNHRIGWNFIPGGIRDCGAGPEIITADAGWRRVMATTLSGSRALGPFDGPESLNRALSCQDRAGLFETAPAALQG